jgi:hypothetical protein
MALRISGTAPPRANFSSDGHLLSITPVRTRLRYEMTSVADAEPDAAEDARLLRRTLRLPAGYNPKAKALADEWRRASANDAEIVARAVDFFRRSKLGYTLEPPPLGRDSVDEFLFSTRAGFCEHFSSAFVFLMRSAGLPARVVTGYLGGDPNPIDGILTVRQSDAHAWCFSPAAAGSPDPTAVPRAGGTARSVRKRPSVADATAVAWLRGATTGALVHKWNVWVLGYNPERQRERWPFRDESADWRSRRHAARCDAFLSPPVPRGR